jgi:alpha-D-ribose 1-methylphosphonate 5-triphosphate synthase subunit PhnI
MAYVAVKGGREAIENAGRFFRYEQVKGASDPLALDQICEQLHLAVDRVMGEGALYAPRLAALALKQSSGDTFEAAFMLRAYRTTQPRLGYSIGQSTENMRVIRRISAAFKEIPGGQILGPTSDYNLRLLDFALAEEASHTHHRFVKELFADVPQVSPLIDTFPKIIEILRKENLIAGCHENFRPEAKIEAEIYDVTRNAITFPVYRSAALQAMAMGETGGLLALAYSNMRGFGVVHPYVGELRMGYLPVNVVNPYTQKPELIGEIKVTEAEIISKLEANEGDPKFQIGYGICLGHNETKAISMGVLDRAIQTGEPGVPSEDPEFVLLHVDGVESMGFCNHFKLPHYVTFQSELDRLRKVQEEA